MSYNAYLRSAHWQRLKYTMYYRKRRRCYFCRSHRKPLVLHHKRYQREGESIVGKERSADLLLLCRCCHDALHTYHLEELFNGTKYPRRMLRDWLLRLSGRSFTRRGVGRQNKPASRSGRETACGPPPTTEAPRPS